MFLLQQTSPDEAYRKFDTIASKHAEQLRKFTKQVQEARSSHDDEAVKKSINDYEDALARWVKYRWRDELILCLFSDDSRDGYEYCLNMCVLQ